MATILHDSDCAVHNMPAYPNGPCNCGADVIPHALQYGRDAVMECYVDGMSADDKMLADARIEAIDQARAALRASGERGSSSSGLSFQKRVINWLMECFSMEICRDTVERNHRFLEESLELVQSLGCTASEAHQLVDYVYGRPQGYAGRAGMSETQQHNFKLLSDGDIERIVDKGLRHRSGVKPVDYLNHWLFIARHFGYATHDDSWGEFEKEFAIIIRRLVAAERGLDALKARLEPTP